MSRKMICDLCKKEIEAGWPEECQVRKTIKVSPTGTKSKEWDLHKECLDEILKSGGVVREFSEELAKEKEQKLHEEW